MGCSRVTAILAVCAVLAVVAVAYVVICRPSLPSFPSFEEQWREGTVIRVAVSSDSGRLKTYLYTVNSSVYGSMQYVDPLAEYQQFEVGDTVALANYYNSLYGTAKLIRAHG